MDLLEGIGVPAWKIGAGEVSNVPLLEYVGRTRKPVILSSGLSDWAELDTAVACVRASDVACDECPAGCWGQPLEVMVRRHP